jgi:hypothetical protein
MEAPFVSMGALAALSTLLDLALKAGVASSNAPLSSASRTSRHQNRGEAHVRQNSYVSERAAARSAAEVAADGFVHGRHGRQPVGAPAWQEPPAEAQSMLISLIAQLILDHAAKTVAAPAREAGHDLSQLASIRLWLRINESTRSSIALPPLIRYCRSIDASLAIAHAALCAVE